MPLIASRAVHPHSDSGVVRAPVHELLRCHGGKPRLYGDVLVSAQKHPDQAHFRGVLRMHEGWGVEAQFWMDGELLIASRFDTRPLAVQWATLEREHIEKGGA